MMNAISTATKVRRQWNHIFSRLRGKNHQSRLYTQQKYFSKLRQLKIFSENKNWAFIIKKFTNGKF